MLKSLFCRLYRWWSTSALAPMSVLVRLIDATVISSCIYCASTRAFILGAATVLAFNGIVWMIVALAIIAVVLFFTYAEKAGWCNLEDGN
jgi:hypothetical protein